MEQTTRTDHVIDYLDAARPYLDDLDEAERADVIADIEEALRETAVDHDGVLDAVLGPPAAYVATYRASAGLGPHTPPHRSRRRRWRDRNMTWLRSQPWWPRAATLARLLRPSWWTLRGVVLTAMIAVILGLVPTALDALSLPQAILVVGGVALSMAAGSGAGARGARRHLHRWANIAAVLAVLILLNDVDATREREIDRAYENGYEAGIGEQHLLTDPTPLPPRP